MGKSHVSLAKMKLKLFKINQDILYADNQRSLVYLTKKAEKIKSQIKELFGDAYTPYVGRR